MVSFSSENMPFSIGSLLTPNQLLPSFPQPWRFSNQSLSGIFGPFRLFISRVALSFQWVPGHAGLPGNELADSLAKIRATLHFNYVPSLLAPVIAKIGTPAILLEDENLCHNSLFCQIPLVSSEKLALLRLARCELSRLRCHGHSFLLSSYL